MLLGMAIPVLEFQNLGYKIRVLYMSFEKFLLAVESGDLSQAHTWPERILGSKSSE